MLLLDGTSVSVSHADDEDAKNLVELFRKVTRTCEPSQPTVRLNVEVSAEAPQSPLSTLRDTSSAAYSYLMSRPDTHDQRMAQVSVLAATVALFTQRTGGLLVHGGIAAHGRDAVFLAGHGSVGKSTACNRLGGVWHSPCDDTSLIVRAPDNQYHIHPWPTWSTFFFGGTGSTWDTQSSYRLAGIAFLSQARRDHIDRLGGADASARLLEQAEVVSRFMPPVPGQPASHARTERFANACHVVACTPVASLALTRDGSFWHLLEQFFVLES